MLDTYRIIIAESDETVRAELRGLLESAGHVIAAEIVDAGAVIGAVEEHRPEALLIGETLLTTVPETDPPLADRVPGPLLALTNTPAEGGTDVELLARRGAFATVARPLRAAEALSTLAVAMQRFRDWQDCQDSLDKLQTKLSDRIIIERAKGHLMKTLDLAEEDAFKRIHFQARQQNRKMRSIAEEILADASDPTGRV